MTASGRGKISNPLFEAAVEIQSLLQKNKWHFCFIGDWLYFVGVR